MAQQIKQSVSQTAILTVAELDASIQTLWQDTLKAEGIGKVRVRGAAQVDVDDEIESLREYQKLVSFYDSSLDDIDNRKRFLVRYASPHYSTETLKRSIIPASSFVRKVVRNLALLYKEVPERGLYDGESEHAANEAFQAMLRGANIVAAAKSWHRKFTLCDCVAVLPMFDANGTLRYRVLTPNEFRFQLDDFGNPEKFVYSSYMFRDSLWEQVLVVWTPTEHYYRDAAGKRYTIDGNVDGANPYGIMPVVIAARDQDNPLSGGMHDLVESNLACNYHWMLENQDSTFAAANMLLGTNLGGQDDILKLSPMDPLVYNGVRQGEGQELPPDLQFVSGTPHGDKLAQIAREIEKDGTIRAGVSAALVNQDAKELSGKALKSLMTEMLEIREDDADIFADFERRLYFTTATIAEVERRANRNVPDIPTDARYFQIDFPSLDFSDDPKAQYELMQMYRDDGIISTVDLFRSVNTDAGDEGDIEAKIAANRITNRKLQTTGLRAFIPGTGNPANNPAQGNTNQ